MKFQLRIGAAHHGGEAQDYLPEYIKRELDTIVQQQLGETRSEAIALLHAQNYGTLTRSHYVDPDFYQLACNEQIPNAAYLNAASISIPKREIQEAGRLVFAREQR